MTIYPITKSILPSISQVRSLTREREFVPMSTNITTPFVGNKILMLSLYEVPYDAEGSKIKI